MILHELFAWLSPNNTIAEQVRTCFFFFCIHSLQLTHATHDCEVSKSITLLNLSNFTMVVQEIIEWLLPNKTMSSHVRINFST
jgi:hypothetical protein